MCEMERACGWQPNSPQKSWQSGDLTSPVRLVYLAHLLRTRSHFTTLLEKYDCNRLVSHLDPPVTGSGLCAYQSRRNDRNVKGELGAVLDILPCGTYHRVTLFLCPQRAPRPATAGLGYEIWDFFLCSFVYIDFFSESFLFSKYHPIPNMGVGP